MSTPDLYTRAARFFLLAEQVSHLGQWYCRLFWEMLASSAVETTVHLPAMAAAVRKAWDVNVLLELARYPLPGVLLPEAVPWFDNLVDAWEVHRASSDVWHQNIARLALGRLDGCGMPDGMARPSRLPEWLEEARRMVGAGYEPARTEPARTGKRGMKRLEALAALADWRPAPGVVTSPETLRDWVAFWQKLGRFRCRIRKGMAAMALLNLPEADLRAASIPMVPTGELLRELTTAIRGEAESGKYLLLLDWQPVEGVSLPADGLAAAAQAWLNVTRHKQVWCRQVAWRQLLCWDRTGSLNTGGMNMLPFLVEAVPTEKDIHVLWEMARWTLRLAALTRGWNGPDPALLRQLKPYWQRHRQYGYWMDKAAGWLGSFCLHRAGVTSEPLERFLKAYLSAVAREPRGDVLFVLAQWTPGPNAPPVVHRKWQQGWQCRLGDTDRDIRQVAVFALVHHALERVTGNGLRRTALEVWRAGTKDDAVTRRLGNFASRFHEVRAHLAAGRVPDFEEEPVPPAQRQYPRLALPPGHITDRKWGIENEKLKMEN